jgi:hypothetical protein
MSVAWEQLVRTGHPAGDAQAVEGLAQRARAEGLAIQATPVAGGGMHVRAYRAAPNAWAQPQPGAQVAPISSRFVAPIAAVPHGPHRHVGWAAPGAAQAGWGQPPQVGGHPHPHAQHAQHAMVHGVPASPPKPPSLTVQAPLSQAGYLTTSQGLAMFRERSIYAAQGAIPAMFQDLAKIGYLDQELEAKRSKWGWFTALGAIALVGGFVISVVLPPLFIGWAILLVAFIFIVRAYGAAKKADMENARFILAHRLLGLIEPDLDPRQPVTLRIGLSPYDDRRKIKSHRKMSVSGGVGQWDEYVYEDDFLHLAARGADGSKIKLVLFETVRERKGWKRGRSGKMKSKRKAQARFSLSLAIDVKAEKHGALARMREAAWRAVRLPVLAKAKSLDVGPDGVALEVVSRAGWKVTTRDARGLPQIVHGASKVDGLARMPGSTIDAFDCTAMSLLSAYQVLNFSAKASKPRAA